VNYSKLHVAQLPPIGTGAGPGAGFSAPLRINLAALEIALVWSISMTQDNPASAEAWVGLSHTINAPTPTDVFQIWEKVWWLESIGGSTQTSFVKPFLLGGSQLYMLYNNASSGSVQPKIQLFYTKETVTALEKAKVRSDTVRE
jgi:hypothetical protein